MNVSRSSRIQKTYEALFALEDVREIFRQSLPSGLDEGEEREFAEALVRVRGIIDGIEGGGEPPSGRVCDGIEVRSREEDYININPIQAALLWRRSTGSWRSFSPWTWRGSSLERGGAFRR
jgi:Sep-tRNA:Cys-tRNA synthetase